MMIRELIFAIFLFVEELMDSAWRKEMNSFMLAKKKKTPSRSSSFNCLSPGVEKLLSLGQPEVQNNNWNFCGAEGGGIVFV